MQVAKSRQDVLALEGVIDQRALLERVFNCNIFVLIFSTFSIFPIQKLIFKSHFHRPISISLIFDRRSEVFD